MIQQRSIALIGFMGSGKSTLGRLVSNELQVSFRDLDAVTEDLAGMRIPSLLEEKGELPLREFETLALTRVCPEGGVLAASSLNDYAEPADEKQVWDVYAGNARVQR